VAADADTSRPKDVRAENAAVHASEESASAQAGADFRSLLQQAAQAQASRDYARAEELYRSALAHGGDTEALAGLGDVSRAQGKRDQARSYYEQVLSRNPQYLPALAALADIKWDSGDRAGASALYRQVVDVSPSNALATRARERIAQSEGAAPKAAAAAPERAPAPPATASSPGKGSEVPPDIDTSDLPGFKR
jgi:tetratricopeptide (TPR) repeat protein